MKKGLGKVFKVAILIIVVILIATFLIVYIGALLEKPPGHTLDFQDINHIFIEEPIHSVEDGLPYATEQAHKWRNDAVLTEIQIISIGRDEIENHCGKINYRFEFPYIEENKPSGNMFVSINTSTNSIEFIEASHDGEIYKRSYDELKTNDLTRKIKKVYDIGINAIGIENIFQYEEPFVRVSIKSDIAIFEVRYSQTGSNIIEHKISIDMNTYDILSKE